MEDPKYTMSYIQLKKMAAKSAGLGVGSDKLKDLMRKHGIRPGERVSEIKAQKALQDVVGYDASKQIVRKFHGKKMTQIVRRGREFYNELDGPGGAGDGAKKKATQKAKDMFTMRGQLK